MRGIKLVCEKWKSKHDFDRQIVKLDTAHNSLSEENCLNRGLLRERLGVDYISLLMVITCGLKVLAADMELSSEISEVKQSQIYDARRTTLHKHNQA